MNTHFNLNEKTTNRLKEIQEKLGTASLAETIRACIDLTYNKRIAIPEYAKKAVKVQKLTRDEERKAHNKKLADNLVKLANGTIDKSGTLISWWSHQIGSSYKRSISIAFLDDSYINLIYQPNEETVRKTNPNFSTGVFIPPIQ